MKRVGETLLIIFLLIAAWVGMSLIFYNGGLDPWLSILIPPCCYIVMALIVRVLDLLYDK